MTDNHPITPPSELVEKWHSGSPLDRSLTVATKAAQWGADEQLKQCVAWLDGYEPEGWAAEQMQEACRPNPPSLKEQAQAELDRLIALIPTEGALAMAEPIRRALEQLDD